MKTPQDQAFENRAVVVQSVKQNPNILIEKLEYWAPTFLLSDEDHIIN